MRFRSALFASLALLFFAASSQAQLQDRVYGATGTATSGTVSGMNSAEVSMGNIKRPVNEIRRIEFGGEPRDLTAARQQAQKGQYENAVESLAKISRVRSASWRRTRRTCSSASADASPELRSFFSRACSS